jgi:hypothetical protein
MRLARTLTPGDRIDTPYFEVPFEVKGARSLEVLLEYDRSRAVIDLGCQGPAGWRGWSGGAKERFVIASTAASTGYCPGDIEDGEWKIILGLHHVPADGTAIVLTINTPAVGSVVPEPVAPRPAGPRSASARRSLPAGAGLTWFAGDCHAHSLHSDGTLSIRQLAARAAGEELDFLAVTDHNTVSHHRELAPAGAEYGVTLLPGQEVTTGRGHANAYGRLGWVDFRCHPDTWLDQVEDEGGFLSINHPVAGDCSWQWSLGRKPTHVEIMHSTWLRDRTDTSIWSWWNAWGTDIIPLGGGDFHRPEDGYPPGLPTTWVAAEDPGEEGIFSALKAGPTALSMGTDSPLLLRVEGELLAVDAEGAVLMDFEGRRSVIRSSHQRLADANRGPYRLETPERKILAISP